jgi:GTPase SAR1 family protein
MESQKCISIQRSRKLVIVGHPMSGRKTLLLSFEHKKFVDSCSQTMFDMPVIPVQIDEKTVSE